MIKYSHKFLPDNEKHQNDPTPFLHLFGSLLRLFHDECLLLLQFLGLLAQFERMQLEVSVQLQLLPLYVPLLLITYSQFLEIRVSLLFVDGGEEGFDLCLIVMYLINICGLLSLLVHTVQLGHGAEQVEGQEVDQADDLYLYGCKNSMNYLLKKT